MTADEFTIVATTDRLTLRHVTAADAAFVCRMLNDPSWLQNIGDRGVRTTADAEVYVREKIVAAYDKFGFGMYLVEYSADLRPLGLVGLVQRESLPGPDLGFAFLPEFWGQGLAFESSNAVLRHAADVLHVSKVLAIVLPENVRSVRLLERLGFVREGTYRAPNRDEALSLYGLALETA